MTVKENNFEGLNGLVDVEFRNFLRTTFFNFCEIVNPSGVYPRFYITRNKENHVDVSCSARPNTSPIWVLALYFFWLRSRHSDIKYSICLSGHIRHMHLSKNMGQMTGFYQEMPNTDPETIHKWKYRFKPIDLDFLLDYYYVPITLRKLSFIGKSDIKNKDKLVMDNFSDKFISILKKYKYVLLAVASGLLVFFKIKK